MFIPQFKYNDNVCVCFNAWISKRERDFRSHGIINGDMELWTEYMKNIHELVKSMAHGSSQDNFCKLDYTESECKLPTKLQSTSYDIKETSTGTGTEFQNRSNSSFSSPMKYFGKIPKILYNKCNVNFLRRMYIIDINPFGNYDDFHFVSESKRFNMRYV
ncbi:variable surface protein [Plasmodium gonderi]|uniref:Variable surface protein n=1 Tax=Plasmodium gonderi TaxID=77519 RepID=A0A1Y1JTV6_PLAGO|nr:variable surface protein [Plasmodium gonderi]GAW84182.1 variable surface protein [Plasmodium gonderi]